jgi:hypothetical protein
MLGRKASYVINHLSSCIHKLWRTAMDQPVAHTDGACVCMHSAAEQSDRSGVCRHPSKPAYPAADRTPRLTAQSRHLAALINGTASLT